MDPSCETCPYICKILDEDEQPIYYFFSDLTVDESILLLSDFLTNTRNKFLEVNSASISAGNQLALLIRTNTLSPDADSQGFFHVIAQAEETDDGRTKLWMRYHTPPICCYQYPVVAELSRVFAAAIDYLKTIDSESLCSR